MTGEVQASEISAIDDLLGGPTRRRPEVDSKPPPAPEKTAAKKVTPAQKTAATKAVAKTAASSTAATARRAGGQTVPRRRRLVNVPLAIKRRTEERADEADLYISDYILAAFQRQVAAVRAELGRPTKKTGNDPFSAPARRNRRRVENPTQLVFTAPVDAANAIDELAEQCNLTRSALVTTVLERDLDTTTP